MAELIDFLKNRDVPMVRIRTLPIVGENADLWELIQVLCASKHSRLLYVVDNEGKLEGAISLGKIMQCVFYGDHAHKVHARGLMSLITMETAKDIMVKKPVYAREDERVDTVLQRMIDSRVKELPVLDEQNQIVADLTMLDVMEFLMGSSETPRPDR